MHHVPLAKEGGVSEDEDCSPYAIVEDLPSLPGKESCRGLKISAWPGPICSHL